MTKRVQFQFWSSCDEYVCRSPPTYNRIFLLALQCFFSARSLGTFKSSCMGILGIYSLVFLNTSQRYIFCYSFIRSWLYNLLHAMIWPDIPPQTWPQICGQFLFKDSYRLTPHRTDRVSTPQKFDIAPEKFLPNRICHGIHEGWQWRGFSEGPNRFSFFVVDSRWIVNKPQEIPMPIPI